MKLYELTDGEIEKVSLVLSPAVDIDFLCFSKEKPVQLKFNDEKRIITGVAILADTPIYRFNKQYGEHYVTFSKSLIEKLVLNFFKHHKNSEVNIEHLDTVEDITIFESYIVNDRIKSSLFTDIPEGSWIVSYKVENPEIYEKIKSGELKGFSIEGYFNYPEIPDETNDLDQLINELM